LRHQNEYFYQVLESLTHPFYVLDARDYSIIVANSASRLGSLALKPTCYSLTHRRDIPCDGIEHVCPLQVVKQTKKPVTVEHIHYDKDGNTRNVEVHAYPILDEHGNVVQMIEYSLDITDRKRLEQEIQDYAEQIKLFAYSISHDLKNPLIAINGLTKLIDKRYVDRLDEKGKEICGQIIKESNQTLSLIEEIHEFIKTKETPFTPEDLDPKEIIRQVREEFDKALASRQLTWSEPEFIPRIKADKLSLLRVFRNLVDNALKHGGNELGEIKIAYKESPDHHIFSVSDDGAGINEANFEKIFGTFQRSPQSKAREGLGLGLAIVQEIAERHGGRAWAERRPGKGVSLFISVAKTL
jgi:light-regulated signal transduction histidine kinase (bacteriophytochrome)